MSNPKKKKNRCTLCNKKLGLIFQKCKYCLNNYCLHHCSIEGHNCKNKYLCIKEQQDLNKSNLLSADSNFSKIEKIL